MITVKIEFLSLLSDLSDNSELVVELPDDSTVTYLITHLQSELGQRFIDRILSDSKHLKKFIILAINGKDIRTLNGTETIFQDMDKISFIPALAGG